MASRDYSLIVATGFSLQWLLLLLSTGSRALGQMVSVVATPGL